jgi:methylase of polypeptide subunit release factors
LTLWCWEYFADQSVPLLIVANLPYIPDQTFDDNADDTVKRREPRMAFVGWNDGLDLYRQMFAQILAYCQHSEHDAVVCFLEMMTWQFDTLTKEFEHSFHFSVTKTFHFNIIIVRADLI